MTQKYSDKGELVALTECLVKPCIVAHLKAKDKDGYQAVVLSSSKKKGEFKADDYKKIKAGQEITVDQVFSVGDKLKITGKTKGRGFTGVVKRWGFHGHPASHGHKAHQRQGGSIGPQTPGRVIKGKKMPGQYGNKKKTVLNLEVFEVDKDDNKIFIKGALPGHNNSWLKAVRID